MISYTRCRVKIVRCGAADRAGEVREKMPQRAIGISQTF